MQLWQQALPPTGINTYFRLDFQQQEQVSWAKFCISDNDSSWFQILSGCIPFINIFSSSSLSSHTGAAPQAISSMTLPCPPWPSFAFRVLESYASSRGQGNNSILRELDTSFLQPFSSISAEQPLVGNKELKRQRNEDCVGWASRRETKWSLFKSPGLICTWSRWFWMFWPIHEEIKQI